MKPLILASGSLQRKKLLKLLGVRFSVCPSKAKEIKKIHTTCTRLVQQNALLKAREVALRVKRGIVIGADTVVYAGKKKIIGKPKDLRDAKRILKVLFSKPSWVYTGLALIDAQSGRQLIDYEKTKVFMAPLSSREVDRYHKKVSPFDKAGGFDIEGHGSMFIQRIEGCYTNVIGLPMPKLNTMLKKMGVSILSVFVAIMVSGCATEFNLATQREETLLYGTEKEIAIGDAVSHQIEKQYKFVEDVDVNERIERVLRRIEEVCDRKELIYSIKVIDEDLMNAVSLPGGYVYIFKKLYDALKIDDELAGVIAHEVGHITAKHGIKRLQAAYGFTFIQVLASQANAQVARGANLALTTLFYEYSQHDEFEADRIGVKYLKKAGYDPMYMVSVLKKLKAEQDKSSPKQFSYWRTHPHIPERMAVVNQEITGKLEFKDYLNLTH